MLSVWVEPGLTAAWQSGRSRAEERGQTLPRSVRTTGSEQNASAGAPAARVGLRSALGDSALRGGVEPDAEDGVDALDVVPARNPYKSRKTCENSGLRMKKSRQRMRARTSSASFCHATRRRGRSENAQWYSPSIPCSAIGEPLSPEYSGCSGAAQLCRDFFILGLDSSRTMEAS